MKTMIKKLLLILFAVCACGALSAQTSTLRGSQQSGVEQFWGTWKLYSMSQETIKNGEKIGVRSFESLESILKENVLPEELFLTIYTFENKIGVCTTGNPSKSRSFKKSSSDFVPYLNVNEKGLFAVNGNHFIITTYKSLCDGNEGELDMQLDFTYVINGETMTLTVEQASKTERNVVYRRSLVYQLTSKD